MRNLLVDKLYNYWHAQLDIDVEKALEKVTFRSWSGENFKFATAVSVMSSSRIEGELLEVDSYVKHKVFNIEYLPNLVEKPNDLYAAYEFARDNKLTKANFLLAHAIATEHLLPAMFRGSVRKGNMMIIEQQTQTIKYEAAAQDIVNGEFNTFWNELEELLEMPMDTKQVFYYAAMIHLVFVKIHPFNDGNGRTGRLLEKWFLSMKLGEKAWFIPSELYYYNHLKAYYHNLGRLGLFYEQLDYEKSIPFLLMLPNSLVFE